MPLLYLGEIMPVFTVSNPRWRQPRLFDGTQRSPQTITEGAHASLQTCLTLGTKRNGAIPELQFKSKCAKLLSASR